MSFCSHLQTVQGRIIVAAHCLYVLSRQDGCKYVLYEGKKQNGEWQWTLSPPFKWENSGTTCCLTAALGHQAINSQRLPRVGNAAQWREHSLCNMVYRIRGRIELKIKQITSDFSFHASTRRVKQVEPSSIKTLNSIQLENLRFHTRLREQQKLGRHPARAWSNSSSAATSPNAVRLKAMRFQAENRAERNTTVHFMYNYLTGLEFDSSEAFKRSKSRSNKNKSNQTLSISFHS